MPSIEVKRMTQFLLPDGEAVIHFDSDGAARLIWGGDGPESDDIVVMSAGNLISAYCYIKLTQGDDEAQMFMRAHAGTGDELTH